jgi:hypothetical protein
MLLFYATVASLDPVGGYYSLSEIALLGAAESDGL